ncbi:DUF1816 domain-containing protein [Thermocoleostomius sinensis]|uniref:DUF1816 domain-containing protein n=1 Tax=Thermocoleostomius sinensis A174 TaxID=2016057 RepID=A0A9E8ZE46_9CYAN|nr:DUF1816 domain-containing protein [Thermocoleostomius sinensis]WAL59550.1 DUF1816 domain-containing protein [Thermocoleostomius sinensis A174]
MKELWITILESLGLAWWVEVVTESPKCTYYFGPFATAKDAKAAQFGYVEDLELEGAKGIKVEIKRCKPTRLTIVEEEEDESNPFGGISPILSGQL